MTSSSVPTSKGRIIVFGILFWYPLAGVTYQFLHYLLGLRRLGYDVYYIEDSGRWVYDPQLNDLTPDASKNVSSIAPVLAEHGFADRWAFRGSYEGGECYGMREDEILALYRESDAFLNVTGAQEIREEQMECPRKIYVESDPFGSQVKAANGDPAMIQMLDAHDTHFTFGENVGAGDCDIPVGRYRWLPTRQPVSVSLWDHDYTADASAYRTITTWHNDGKDLTYKGEKYYWTKDREFTAVLDAPKLTGSEFELATRVDSEVKTLLNTHGWSQADPVSLSRDPVSYRNYIQGSRGEFTVARDQYVRPRTGWFSDRSACYLAAGRPVITQQTGFDKFLPTGRGLFGFSSLDDVVSAVEAIEADYEGNCAGAKEIANEYFAAEKVLQDLMSRADLA